MVFETIRQRCLIAVVALLARIKPESAAGRIEALGDADVRSDWAMRLFKRLPDGDCSEVHERSGSLLMRLLDCVAKEHLGEWAAEVIRRTDKYVHFGGFHVYMSLKDFLILKAHYGLAPEYVYDSRARRLVFGRELRNRILNETDAAFWDAFVQRCVVPNGALDENVDHFGFRYDEELAEECQTYWSAKRAMSVLFGTKTGRLVLEEWGWWF